MATIQMLLTRATEKDAGEGETEDEYRAAQFPTEKGGSGEADEEYPITLIVWFPKTPASVGDSSRPEENPIGGGNYQSIRLALYEPDTAGGGGNDGPIFPPDDGGSTGGDGPRFGTTETGDYDGPQFPDDNPIGGGSFTLTSPDTSGASGGDGPRFGTTETGDYDGPQFPDEDGTKGGKVRYCLLPLLAVIAPDPDESTPDPDQPQFPDDDTQPIGQRQPAGFNTQEPV